MATSSWKNQEPAAITIVFQKNWSMCTSFHACGMFAQSMPFGQSARGCRSVSCVGVTADFASHSSGPRPAMTSPAKSTKCTPPMPSLHAAPLAVVVRDDAAVGRLVAAAVRPTTADDAAQAGRRVRGVDPFEDGRLGRGHEVLQRSVSLKYSQLSSASTIASITLSAVASP